MPLLFRGISAAASLKLDIRRPNRFGMGLFRGISAAASLKHLTDVELDLIDIPFPQHFRCGLIEASRPPVHKLAMNRFSAAFPLRPH